MSAVTAKVGQYVEAGQKIGIAGTTGFSTGIHLHLTLQYIDHGLSNYVVDDVVDPEPYLRTGTAPNFDEMDYVADVTIPDGTVMRAGQSLTKRGACAIPAQPSGTPTTRSCTRAMM